MDELFFPDLWVDGAFMQSVNPSVKSKSIRGGCRSQEATPWQLFMDSPQKMVCPLLVVGICFFFDCIFFKISLLEMIYPKFVFYDFTGD